MITCCKFSRYEILVEQSACSQYTGTLKHTLLDYTVDEESNVDRHFGVRCYNEGCIGEVKAFICGLTGLNIRDLRRGFLYYLMFDILNRYGMKDTQSSSDWNKELKLNPPYLSLDCIRSSRYIV